MQPRRGSPASANVAATVTYDPTTRRATLNPNANLQTGVTYEATVATGAKDLRGNLLDQDPNASGNRYRTWRFTVRR